MSNLNDIIKSNFIKDIEKTKETQNHTLYELFKPINKMKTVKIYPMTISENKRIGELIENIPKYDTINESNFQDAIDDYINKLKEIQSNINEIVSEKIKNENGESIKISNLNLLDYQFILFYIFSIANKSVKFRLDLNEKIDENDLISQMNSSSIEKVSKYATIEIPLTTSILDKVKNNLKYHKKINHTENEETFNVELDYKIVKLDYNGKGANIESKNVEKTDFKNWLNDLTYKINDNISLYLKPITILNYLDIYMNILKLKTALDNNVHMSITNTLIESNLTLFKNLILFVDYNKELYAPTTYPEIIQLLDEHFFQSMTDDQIIELSSIIYGNTYRMEIDVKVFNTNNELIKEDTWFDTGLSFFLTA
jgi:hypothetical protein